MTRRTAIIIAALFYSNAAAAPLVTFESPCECLDNHGKQRWAEKNDPALPPSEASAIQAVTPSDIFNWEGPTEYLVPSSERIWSEQKWYALTGRVVDVRAEEDGDLHIALQDVTGDKPGAVVVEIPAKPQWCELRKIVFGWTEVQFPFRVRFGRKLKFREPLIVTVVGKAFFDVGHAPARQKDPNHGGEAYDWLKNALASSSLFRGHFPLWRQLRPSRSVLLLP